MENMNARWAGVRSIAWLGVSCGMSKHPDRRWDSLEKENQRRVTESGPPRIRSPAQISVRAQQEQRCNNEPKWSPKNCVDGTGCACGQYYLKDDREAQQTKQLDGDDQRDSGDNGCQDQIVSCLGPRSVSSETTAWLADRSEKTDHGKDESVEGEGVARKHKRQNNFRFRARKKCLCVHSDDGRRLTRTR